MGFHNWTDKCPHCGFEQLEVSSYNNIYIEAACPICGYQLWSDEKKPIQKDIESAKNLLQEMNKEDIEESIEQFREDSIPLIQRPKNKS